MRKGKIPEELWETYRAMSVDVGRILPFMKETACMNIDERKLIGISKFAKDLFSEDKEFVEFIDTMVIPFLTYEGRAKWNRDVVTDLGFALALRKSGRKSLTDVLDFVPEKTDVRENE